MTAPTSLTHALVELAETARLTAERVGPEIERAAEMFSATIKRGGTLLFFCGNGGSAADAQHMATEYVVRYMRNRKAYPSVALTTDTSHTAAGNDFGFDHIFSRQIEALCRPGDLLSIHSTSGNSPNVLRAAEAARAKGVATIGLTAKDGGALRDLVDLCIIVPTERTDRAQEIHLCIQHLICDMVEQTILMSR